MLHFFQISPKIKQAQPVDLIFEVFNTNFFYFVQVGYAMTTFQRETDQPVIGFDMGGNLAITINWTVINSKTRDTNPRKSKSGTIKQSCSN